MKRNKAPNEQTIPLLMPRHHMVIPHYMGRGREINIESKSTEDAGKDVREQTAFPKQSLVQDIPFLLPQEADGAVVNSSGAKKLNGTCTKHNLIDQPTGNCGKFSFSSQKSETETLVQDTQTKRFADDIDFLDLQSETILSVGAQTRVKLSDEEWGTSDDGDPIHETGQVGPCTACHCQVSYSLSLPLEYLEACLKNLQNAMKLLPSESIFEDEASHLYFPCEMCILRLPIRKLLRKLNLSL